MEADQNRPSNAGDVQSTSVHVLSHQPLVMTVDNVMNQQETQQLLLLAKDRLQRAKVSFDTEYGVTDGRSGRNCWLRYDDHPLVQKIGERISKLAGMPLANAEALQVLHYGADQEYRPHYDAYDLLTPRGQRCCRFGGQRLVTALVYLNRVTEGGGTAFPKLGLQVDPLPGRMVLFQNTGENTNKPHPNSLHAGMPVVKGEKWAFNIWFHTRPMTEKQQFETVNDDANSWCIRTNRASPIMQAACRLLAESMPPLSQPVCWTYWDTFGGKECDLSDLPKHARVFKLLDRKHSNPLANKGMLPQLLKEKQLTRLAPVTVMSVAEATTLQLPADKVWFVKPWFKTGGQGMFCLRHAELASLDMPERSVLQLEVDKPLLKRGHKFTTRIYFLLHNANIYLYRNGFTLRHAVPYIAGSTDYKVQIDHTGYAERNTAIEMRPGSDDEDYQAHFNQLQTFAHELTPLLLPFSQACGEDDYLVLGVDVMLCTDGSVKLIEINTMPNFIHTETVNETVNIPLFESVMRVLLSGGDERMIRLTEG
jgi:prolyl 4-hydroxylase